MFELFFLLFFTMLFIVCAFDVSDAMGGMVVTFVVAAVLIAYRYAEVKKKR